ncbi:MAG: YjfB family protein [Lachnospiraceae bacterium]|nr:YjfB family protein [Lachnospiraceae bacterium]
MNIPELSTALSNVQAANQVSVAVLDKALESAEATGAGILNMMDRSMELSVNPNIGSNIDIFV